MVRPSLPTLIVEIYRMLEPLPEDERRRVIGAVLVLLCDDDRGQSVGPTDDRGRLPTA